MNPDSIYFGKPKPLPQPPADLLKRYEAAREAWFKVRKEMEWWEADNIPEGW